LVKVKICGLTRLEDANLAVELGASALGFIFAPVSKRFNPPESRDWIRNLKVTVPKVGVFMDQPVSEINEIAEFCKLDRIQYHGFLTDSEISGLSVPFWQVISSEDLASSTIPIHPNIEFYLIDSSIKGKTGGTGIPFDWKVLQNLNLPKPIIVAGGLSPDNVSDLLSIYPADFIDLSSGVEQSPGIKDAGKMRKLFEVLRGDW